MRRVGLLLVSALVGLLVGCETPSTTKQSFLPYVGATLSAGIDGEKTSFYLYLAEGKLTGPAINDATVTLDGALVAPSGFGSYWYHPTGELIAGEGHLLKISHPSFNTISVSVTIPSGAAPTYTVLPPPPVYPAKRDTSSEIAYTVTPESGAWPSNGVSVVIKGYDETNQMNYAISSLPMGSVGGKGTFPVGKAARVGFEVRNQVLVKIPGATADSFFRADGDQVVKMGFNPLTDLVQYRLQMDIEKGWFSTYLGANAYVRDRNYVFLSGVSFSVDGTPLAEQTQKGYYYVSIPTEWTAGSVHDYSITDQSGKVLTGQISKPAGTLGGLTFTPAKGTLAASYSVSPPPSGWPTGSYIECRGVVGTEYWSTSKAPTGTESVVFDSTFIGKASSITFISALKNVYPLEGYLSGSQISVLGTETSW